MNLFNILLIILGAMLIGYAVNWAFLAIKKSRLKSVGGELEADAFQAGMHKAQVIDVREKKEFDASHISVARNIPYPQLKERMPSLRKDMPVYVYDFTGDLAIRAASNLKKAGFNQVYWLKKGFDTWSGKTKSNKKEN